MITSFTPLQGVNALLFSFTATNKVFKPASCCPMPFVQLSNGMVEVSTLMVSTTSSITADQSGLLLIRE